VLEARTRDPASSIRSMALSGRKRSLHRHTDAAGTGIHTCSHAVSHSLASSPTQREATQCNHSSQRISPSVESNAPSRVVPGPREEPT